MLNNRMAELLISIGLSSNGSIRPYFPRVRDRDDVGVLRCDRSEVYESTLNSIDATDTLVAVATT